MTVYSSASLFLTIHLLPTLPHSFIISKRKEKGTCSTAAAAASAASSKSRASQHQRQTTQCWHTYNRHCFLGNIAKQKSWLQNRRRQPLPTTSNSINYVSDIIYKTVTSFCVVLGCIWMQHLSRLWVYIYLSVLLIACSSLLLWLC